MRRALPQQAQAQGARVRLVLGVGRGGSITMDLQAIYLVCKGAREGIESRVYSLAPREPTPRAVPSWSPSYPGSASSQVHSSCVIAGPDD